MESLGNLAGSGLMMLAVIATAGMIACRSRFYRQELAVSGTREWSLDGLRGLAALMVAMHHAAIGRVWLINNEWGDTRSLVLQLAGPAAVVLFFMLTGYLFWSKARQANGRLKPWKLWRGRLCRIAPLYLFSLLLVLLVAVGETGGSWLTADHWKPLLRLLALGALKWQNVGPVNLNNYNAGVVWTLWYEWSFYLALPILAWLATGRKIFGFALVAYVAVAAGLCLHLNLQPGLFFLLGMLCPVLLENSAARSQLQTPRAAATALLAGVLLLALGRNYLLSRLPTASLASACFPVFVIAAAGNPGFGLLVNPAMRCLGALSFSLYLLHGMVFKLVFSGFRRAGLASLPPMEYWLVMTVVACALTGLCSLTYRWIEFPFLSASQNKRPA
jgi:peptidoglycan/LPS O-acetylase OafA/YrhL